MPVPGEQPARYVTAQEVLQVGAEEVCLEGDARCLMSAAWAGDVNWLVRAVLAEIVCLPSEGDGELPVWEDRVSTELQVV